VLLLVVVVLLLLLLLLASCADCSHHGVAGSSVRG
jgi:hypothetical protein